jgi:hypothetical protein
MGGRETWLRIMANHGAPLSGCVDRETVTLFLAKECSTWQEIKKKKINNYRKKERKKKQPNTLSLWFYGL